jgi:hypothetical protein
MSNTISQLRSHLKNYQDVVNAEFENLILSAVLYSEGPVTGKETLFSRNKVASYLLQAEAMLVANYVSQDFIDSVFKSLSSDYLLCVKDSKGNFGVCNFENLKRGHLSLILPEKLLYPLIVNF